MHPQRKNEQHIAVFGQTGSGKTVLVSSFYGAAQEREVTKNELFDIVADSTSQGGQLHENYLGMRNSSKLPGTTRFASTSYSFSLKLKKGPAAKQKRKKPEDVLRLVWHDYPGEWFEEDISEPEEAQRRVDTFRSLLSSDVALLLVDGQRLVDNAGEEQRYLKALLTQFRNELRKLKDQLLDGGKPLVTFPRIWIMALSKSDLLPDMSVTSFMELLIEKARPEIDALREVLGELIEEKEALSVGEDFVLLSSAKFDANKIEVTKRVGMNLFLPIAAVLPLERHLRWAKRLSNGGKVGEKLLQGAGLLAEALGGVGAIAGVLAGRSNKVLGAIAFVLSNFGAQLSDAAKMGGDKLHESHTEALAKHEYLKAILTGFQMDLEKSEEEQILLRSRR